MRHLHLPSGVEPRPRPGGRARPGLASLVAALPVTLLVACVSVSSEGRPPPLGAISTYAWSSPAVVAPAGAEDVEGQVHDELVRELSRRGLREVDAAQADVLVSYHLWIESKVRHNDPYFAAYATEQVEIGTLAVDLIQPESGELVWRGSASRELRISAVLAGPFDRELTPTDAPRRWRIPELLARIVREFERGR